VAKPKGPAQLSRDLDSILKSSPVGALLPLAVFVLMELVRPHALSPGG
jgi:hypothetical protein